MPAFPKTEYGEIRWERFDGGKNSRHPSTQIDRNQAQDCLNVYTDLRGALVKRPGFVVFAQDGAAPISTFWAYDKLNVDGSFTRYLLKAAGTTVRAWNGAAWSDVATALTSGLRFGYAEANNKAYFANGTDGLKQWDGTTLTAIAGAPAGIQGIAWHSNRMYGVTGKSSRLYFSDLGDPTSWPVLNFMDFDVDDGDRITGIRPLPDGALFVAKEHSRHLLRGTGPGSYTSRSFRDGVGCVSHWAIAHVPEINQLVFLDRDGVYTTDGVQVHLISDLITPDIRAWSQATLQLATMAYHNFHLHLAVPTGSGATANTMTYVWDARAKGWWPWSITASHFLQYFDGSSEMLLAGDPVTGNLYKLWTGDNDNGAAIYGWWKGRDDSAGDSTRHKRYKRAFGTEKAYLGTHSVTVVWNQDFGKQSTAMTIPVNAGTFPEFDVAEWDVSAFASAEGVVPAVKMVASESSYVRPEVYQSGVDCPFALLELVLESKLTNRRVGT